MSEYLFNNVDRLLLFGYLVSIKILLICSVPSTDFEVHRNWLAITFNVPLPEWYTDETSIWTLDYPPFFAFFEWILAQIGALIDPNMLVLSKDAIQSKNVILFQKLSVIALDVVFFFGAALVAEYAVAHSLTLKLNNVKWSLFLLLVCNAPLLLLDNMHFQYNAFMYGIFFIGSGFIFRRQFLVGAVLLSTLLNFKHIYLYFVPGFILFFSKTYLLPMNRLFATRAFFLGLAVGIPLVAAFGPFAMLGGIDGIRQIIMRLFPFKRGLTHSYWAPNFWALYNTADFVFYKFGSTNASLVPGYTSGIVQVYDHMILPNITPFCTHMLVLSSVIISLASLARNCVLSHQELFTHSIVLSAFSFFFFSWHVHEKAILLIQIPYTVCVHQNRTFAPSYVLLSAVSIISQLPLIHIDPTEDILKYSVVIVYFLLTIFALSEYLGVSLSSVLLSAHMPLLIALVLVEIYKNVHHTVFGTLAAFLPLMMTSAISAVAVLTVYINFIYITCISNDRRKCEKKYSSI